MGRKSGFISRSDESGSFMAEKREWLFFGDFVRFYILFHAARSPASALELASKLNGHGYRLNARKLERVLDSLETHGYLIASGRPVSNGQPKQYKATTKGREFVEIAKTKLRKLAVELLP
jgi:DNA-binding PadR family transcriptional regulator